MNTPPFKKFNLMEETPTTASDRTKMEEPTGLPQIATATMVERSQFYQGSERIYEFGFYDGYQFIRADNAELRKALEEASTLIEMFRQYNVDLAHKDGDWADDVSKRIEALLKK